MSDRENNRQGKRKRETKSEKRGGEKRKSKLIAGVVTT